MFFSKLSFVFENAFDLGEPNTFLVNVSGVSTWSFQIRFFKFCNNTKIVFYRDSEIKRNFVSL